MLANQANQNFTNFYLNIVFAQTVCLKQLQRFKKKLTAHTHTQPFYGSLDFVPDNPSEPVPEETFTHSHLS